MNHRGAPPLPSRLSASLVVASLLAAQPLRSDDLSNVERGQTRNMLNVIRNDISKHYYDPAFHGMDLGRRFAEADDKLKQATSFGQAFGAIAQTLLDLDDRHTLFIPPARTSRTNYGWWMQMIGDRCYVMAVRPGSDAEARGLKPGDEVYSVNGLGPTLENLWKIQYLFYSLRPQPGLRVVLQDGKVQRTIDVMAKVTPRKRLVDLTGVDGGNDIWTLLRENESESHLMRQRYLEMGEDLMVWKMPLFDLSEGDVDELMEKASHHKALVLDLRGNPGGAVTTLERLLGWLLGRETKIAELRGRRPHKPMVAKPRGGGRQFAGKLVVLVDSASASASEILARVVQLEKRGTVVGDHTAGAVMLSRTHQYQMGADTIVLYYASITEADVIMADGKSLEHAGTIPDELLLPTPSDLKDARDPVLARAAELAGRKVTAQEAGTMFPIEWGN